MGSEAAAEGDAARPVQPVRRGAALVRQPERGVVAPGLRGAAPQRSKHAHGSRWPRHQGWGQRHRLQPRRLPARDRAHAPWLRRPDRRERQLACEQRVRRRRLHGRREGRPPGHRRGQAGDRRRHPLVAEAGRRAAREAARLLHRLQVPGAGPAEVARRFSASLAARGTGPAAGADRGREPGVADGLRPLAVGAERRQGQAAEAAAEADSGERLGGRGAGRPDREPDGAAGGLPRLGRVAALRRQALGAPTERARADPEVLVRGARQAGADLQGREDGEEAAAEAEAKVPSRSRRRTTAS